MHFNVGALEEEKDRSEGFVVDLAHICFVSIARSAPAGDGPRSVISANVKLALRCKSTLSEYTSVVSDCRGSPEKKSVSALCVVVSSMHPEVVRPPTFSRYCSRSATASRSLSASCVSYSPSRDWPARSSVAAVRPSMVHRGDLPLQHDRQLPIVPLEQRRDGAQALEGSPGCREVKFELDEMTPATSERCGGGGDSLARAHRRWSRWENLG